jgi:hypothetical protein
LPYLGPKVAYPEMPYDLKMARIEEIKNLTLRHQYTVKESLAVFPRPQPGCHLPKLSLARSNQIIGRVELGK